MTATENNAANAQANLTRLDAISQILKDVTTAKNKVDAKVDDTNSEIHKLQEKAAGVDSGNQGKMKKLQRKSKFLMDKVKDLEDLQGQLDVKVKMLHRRKLEYLTGDMIINRATVVGGDIHLRDEADAFVMHALNIRRQTEAFDMELTTLFLKALPKQFRE